ncbi:MAG TPA: peptide-methionine (S)-S-oxide reductase MsrA [Edaphocola sp.]|nr:peptide-methionine (S)-S-oxide reductase MsrA [Edaphocola sp.]
MTKPDTQLFMNAGTAIFACGCFWCLEAQFQHLDGVLEIIPGFTGGHVPHPTYEQVCTGTTGHAEACKITFDAGKISYKQLLMAFFEAHDPTQLNRQGNDIGTQYRSALFYLDEEQHAEIEACLELLTAQGVYDRPIVTQVCPATAFYPADDYHKDYYNLHGDNPYCALVVQPKVKKFLRYLGKDFH